MQNRNFHGWNLKVFEGLCFYCGPVRDLTILRTARQIEWAAGLGKWVPPHLRSPVDFLFSPVTSTMTMTPSMISPKRRKPDTPSTLKCGGNFTKTEHLSVCQIYQSQVVLQITPNSLGASSLVSSPASMYTIPTFFIEAVRLPALEYLFLFSVHFYYFHVSWSMCDLS